MPSFSDSAVLVILALLLFGPKKLPVLARQLGKLMADFRRASNEFRTQMEEELRISEQAERQKQVAALQTAAPVDVEPHVPPPAPSFASTDEPASPYMVDSPDDPPAAAEPSAAEPPAPIATSGELSILPPATGLPVAQTPSQNTEASPAHEPELETETLHG